MTSIAQPAPPLAEPLQRRSGLAVQLLLALSAIVGYAAFWWVGKLSSVPPRPHDAVSLLLHWRSGITTLLMLGCVLTSVLIGSLVSLGVRFDAGLLCASFGLIALSYRGGTVGDALRAHAGDAHPNVFITFARELVIWYAILILGWLMLWRFHRRGWLRQDSAQDHLEDVHETVFARIIALVAQTLFCGIAMMALVQNESKGQTVLGIGVAAYIATLATHSIFPVRPSIWFWIAPLLVGIANYLWAFGASPQWSIGLVGVEGRFVNPAAARALPIDFAGAGTAGALIAYWLSRRFHLAELQQLPSLLHDVPAVLAAENLEESRTSDQVDHEESEPPVNTSVEEVLAPAEPLRLSPDILPLRPGLVPLPPTSDPEQTVLEPQAVSTAPPPTELPSVLSLAPEEPGQEPELLGMNVDPDHSAIDVLHLQPDVADVGPNSLNLPTNDLQLGDGTLLSSGLLSARLTGPAVLRLQGDEGELQADPTTPSEAPAENAPLNLDEVDRQGDALHIKPLDLPQKPKP